MNDYTVLSQEEQDEILVSYLEAQERDHFCHQINLDRFDKMLQSMPEGEYKTHIQKLRAETAQRLEQVNHIIEATKKQLPSADRVQAARTRIKNKATIK